MIDGLPFPVGLSVFGLGWVLFGSLAWLVIRKLISGDLLTRREGDAKDAENVRLRGSNDYLQERLGTALDALHAQTDMATALRQAAERQT